MNILTYDICATVIGLVFLITMAIRRQFNDRSNKIMFFMLVGMVLSAVGDLFSSYYSNIAVGTASARAICYVANVVYFIAHGTILPLYIIYIYSSNDIWHILKAKKWLLNAWGALFAFSVVLILQNGLIIKVFHVDERGVYCRDNGVYIVYVLAAVFGIWGIATIWNYRKLINRDKVITLLVIYPFIVGAVIIQFLFPTYLVESFAAAIAFMVFLVMVRIEENQIDPITGAIKYNTGIEKVSKNFISKKPVTVVLLKYVNYKNIQLYLGQQGFDKFLNQTTARMKHIAKENGYSASIFYLEYGLFAYLGENGGKELALKIADETYEEFKKEIQIGDLTVKSHIRVCQVSCPEDMSDFPSLFSMGISFHKTLKDRGQVDVFSEFKNDKDFKIRNEMSRIINRGLNDGNFEMYYQPIYSVSEKRFVSAEALIRLNDPKYGFVPPSFFLPVAELNGTIHDIGDFVLKSVISFVSKYDITSLGIDYVELNLSASQCIEVDLIDKIKALLDEHNVPPEMISLELTEAAANINPAIVDENVKELHDFGIRIALDDYGTGYSNIKRVTSLPINQVKLDKSFVDMVENPVMWIVIQDTIKMLKEMGKEVLVEGVEEEEIVTKFTELDADLIQGCDLIQGFYFCKPLPEREFVKFVKEHM